MALNSDHVSKIFSFRWLTPMELAPHLWLNTWVPDQWFWFIHLYLGSHMHNSTGWALQYYCLHCKCTLYFTMCHQYPALHFTKSTGWALQYTAYTVHCTYTLTWVQHFSAFANVNFKLTREITSHLVPEQLAWFLLLSFSILLRQLPHSCYVILLYQESQ